MIRDKSGSVIYIGLLVLFVLLIVSFALFYFSTNKADIQKTLYTAGFVGQIYERESVINIYLQEVFDKSAQGVGSEEEFILKAKNNFNNDKILVNIFVIDEKNNIYFPEYEQFITQLNKENVKIIEKNGNKFVRVSFIISIKDQLSGKENPYLLNNELKEYKNKFFAVYTYNKVFESKIV